MAKLCIIILRDLDNWSNQRSVEIWQKKDTAGIKKVNKKCSSLLKTEKQTTENWLMAQIISHPNVSFSSKRIKESEDGKVSMAFLMGKTAKEKD